MKLDCSSAAHHRFIAPKRYSQSSNNSCEIIALDQYMQCNAMLLDTQFGKAFKTALSISRANVLELQLPAWWNDYLKSSCLIKYVLAKVEGDLKTRQDIELCSEMGVNFKKPIASHRINVQNISKFHQPQIRKYFVWYLFVWTSNISSLKSHSLCRDSKVAVIEPLTKGG